MVLFLDLEPEGQGFWGLRNGTQGFGVSGLGLGVTKVFF